MASIDKRGDGRYRARWREYPGGPQKTRHFDKRADAQRFLDGIRGDLSRGLYIDPAGGRTPFREYAEQWRVHKHPLLLAHEFDATILAPLQVAPIQIDELDVKLLADQKSQ